MNNKKHFISLNFKLFLVVLGALIATAVAFFLLNVFQDAVAERVYLSDTARERQVNEAYEELAKTIKRYSVKSTDTERLQNWIKKQDYVHLMVYDNKSISFEGGWLESETEEKNEVEYDESSPRITPETFNEDLKNRIIDFNDGPYYVFIDVFREQHFYRIMFFVKAIVCMLTLIGIVLIYNARVLGRVIRLSQRVQTVSDGDLDAVIEATSNDEVGLLATNVDNMRDSMLERLKNEQEAFDANTQLITAMSHDIRTPLTSLIGYLDIIKSGKYNSQEEMDKYVDTCRDKAFQLKDLSDKLFQYFLVFGSKEEKELEVFDASILLHQIISEHSAEIMSYGFTVDLDYRIEEDVDIKADVSGMRRLFDNIFSNIMKYADKSSHVRVHAIEENNQIIVRVFNAILETSRMVESNKIGLKTCEKICKDMGGDFSYRDEGPVFVVRIILPVYKEIEEGGSEEGDPQEASSVVSSDGGYKTPMSERITRDLTDEIERAQLRG